MNEDVFKGKWKEIKGKVSQKWAKLTGDQVDRIDGRMTELSGELQKTYGIKKEEAREQINTFLDRHLPEGKSKSPPKDSVERTTERTTDRSATAHK